MSSIQIPGYKVLSQLGQGGMSTVYLAEQLSFERRVALKVLTANRAETEQFGKRFLREAKIAAHLSHPHIVAVHDTGTVDGSYFLAMEYLPGGDLRTRIEAGVALLEALDIIVAMADAVDYASRQGVVHRDLKPANVMFREDGSVAIVDFGIAREMNSNTEVTQVGTILGTPRYMSPEQSLGEGVDVRSDLYSIGIVFYEMLSGDVPFKASSAAGVGAQHITAEVPPLPAATAVFQGIVNRLLEKNPEDRYQSGEELINDLEDLREELPADLATTILLSKPRAAATGSQSSGVSSMRSRRRKTRARKAKTGGRRWLATAGNALVAGLVSLLVVGGFYWITRAPEEIPREVVPAAPPAPVRAAPDDEQAVLRVADQTLDKAGEALAAGQIEIVDGYIDLLQSLELDSPIYRARILSLQQQRDAYVHTAARIAQLRARFDQYLEQGALYQPEGASAFSTMDELAARSPEHPELPAMRARLEANTREAVRRALDAGDIATAISVAAQLEGAGLDALVKELNSAIDSEEKQRKRRQRELSRLYKKVQKLQGDSELSEAERIELLQTYAAILRISPGDDGVRTERELRVEGELQRARAALAAGDVEAARDSLEVLRKADITGEEASALARETAALAQARDQAVVELARLQDFADDFDEDARELSSGQHVGAAAQLVNTYRTLAQVQQRYPWLEGYTELYADLNGALADRVRELADAGLADEAQVYVQAMLDAGLENAAVTATLADLGAYIEAQRKPRRRSFSTF